MTREKGRAVQNDLHKMTYTVDAAERKGEGAPDVLQVSLFSYWASLATCTKSTQNYPTMGTGTQDKKTQNRNTGRAVAHRLSPEAAEPDSGPTPRARGPK